MCQVRIEVTPFEFVVKENLISVKPIRPVARMA